MHSDHGQPRFGGHDGVGEPRRGPTVACVGVYIVDVLGRPIDDIPSGQDLHLLQQIRITVAGTAGGTSVDLARLGLDVTAVGAIGTDTLADFLLQVLTSNGISVEHFARKPSVQTSATILPISSSGSRPAWHVIGANGEFELADVPWPVIARSDFVHLGGITAMPKFDGSASLELLRFAKANGATTTADFLDVKGDDPLGLLRGYLPFVDIFMPNLEETRKITGIEDPGESAKLFRDLGAGCVIIKMGGDGCLISEGSSIERLPAFQVPVVDSTGCGDAFCAGVIAGVGMGWPLIRAADLGNAGGGLTLGGLGSDAGIRSLDQTIAFMDSTPRRTPSA